MFFDLLFKQGFFINKVPFFYMRVRNQKKKMVNQTNPNTQSEFVSVQLPKTQNLEYTLKRGTQGIRPTTDQIKSVWNRIESVEDVVDNKIKVLRVTLNVAQKSQKMKDFTEFESQIKTAEKSNLLRLQIKTPFALTLSENDVESVLSVFNAQIAIKYGNKLRALTDALTVKELLQMDLSDFMQMDFARLVSTKAFETRKKEALKEKELMERDIKKLIEGIAFAWDFLDATTKGNWFASNPDATFEMLTEKMQSDYQTYLTTTNA